ncbi:MAG: DUF3048 domain-containing protein, partial [Lachnospiraceae bacterium]|nr:DUF3048 domain-containing protein [Lachnospiraceae bacterium]
MLCTAMAGCSGTEETSSPAVSEETPSYSWEELTQDDSQAPSAEASEEVVINPENMYRSELTNEWIDKSLKDQRPVAIMVDNEKTALDHYGLTQADIVYEIMNSTANGEVTRFMALVKDWEK